MLTADTAKPATDLIGEPASNAEQLGGPLGIIDTPNTDLIQDVLSEMDGFDITDLWDAVVGETP